MKHFLTNETFFEHVWTCSQPPEHHMVLLSSSKDIAYVHWLTGTLLPVVRQERAIIWGNELDSSLVVRLGFQVLNSFLGRSMRNSHIPFVYTSQFGLFLPWRLSSNTRGFQSFLKSLSFFASTLSCSSLMHSREEHAELLHTFRIYKRVRSVPPLETFLQYYDCTYRQRKNSFTGLM